MALEVVRRVIDDGAYSNLVMPGALARSGLDPRDRAFAADLAYGTIRHLRSIDWALDQHASRPVARMSPAALGPLRLGAYQLLFGGVAAHAAVGESVALSGPKERGFVNAVLRRLAAEPPAWPQEDDDAAVSVRTGLDAWGIAELRHILPAAEVERAAAAFAARGDLCLRTNTCATTVDELEGALRSAGHESSRSELDPACLLLDGGDPTELPGWERGWFAVQDHASAFVVSALDVRPGQRVLDLCAGPGGKTAHLCCLARPARVTAGDLHPRRARLVRRTSHRLGMAPLVLAQDATAPAVRGPFDRVLVDAPCSGIGSARRRPELLWRPRRKDLSRFGRMQVAIASSAAELLAPGGRLVYSVCTFPRAETDAAADAIVRHRPDLVPVAIDGPQGEAVRIRLWPHRNASDGMFVAAFVKLG